MVCRPGRRPRRGVQGTVERRSKNSPVSVIFIGQGSEVLRILLSEGRGCLGSSAVFPLATRTALDTVP